jgi:hypothetical protein
MKIDIQKLIEMITIEVMAQLAMMGVEIEHTREKKERVDSVWTFNHKCKVIDMNSYRSPVLTENQLTNLTHATEEVIIPIGTVITPGAKDIIRQKKIKLIYK